MNLCLARIVLGIGIAWATTVIRREVGKNDGLPASLDVEDESSNLHAVRFSAGGQMISGDHDIASQTVKVQEGASVKKERDVDFAEGESSDFKYKDVEMCDYDFPVGANGTDQCADDNTEFQMTQPDMCREAARQANASIDENTFYTDEAYQQLRPRGCFKWTCYGSNDVCYFYNTWDDPENNVQGEKVCHRPKFENGTLDSTQPTGVTCPTGYQHVIKENNCLLASTCLGSCAGDQFRISQSERNNYPSGCFMHADQGCYFFNPLYDENGTRWAEPTSPNGIPLCNVSFQAVWS